MLRIVQPTLQLAEISYDYERVLSLSCIRNISCRSLLAVLYKEWNWMQMRATLLVMYILFLYKIDSISVKLTNLFGGFIIVLHKWMIVALPWIRADHILYSSNRVSTCMFPLTRRCRSLARLTWTLTQTPPDLQAHTEEVQHAILFTKGEKTWTIWFIKGLVPICELGVGLFCVFVYYPPKSLCI